MKYNLQSKQSERYNQENTIYIFCYYNYQCTCRESNLQIIQPSNRLFFINL